MEGGTRVHVPPPGPLGSSQWAALARLARIYYILNWHHVFHYMVILKSGF